MMCGAGQRRGEAALIADRRTKGATNSWCKPPPKKCGKNEKKGGVGFFFHPCRVWVKILCGRSCSLRFNLADLKLLMRTSFFFVFFFNLEELAHLRRCAAGQPTSDLPDPGCCCWIAGADEDWPTDLHGVALWGRSQCRFVGHGEGSERMSLLAVLFLSGTLGAIALGPRGGPLARIPVGVRRLVQLYKLTGGRVELPERERRELKVADGEHIRKITKTVTLYLKKKEKKKNYSLTFKSSVFTLSAE